MSITAIVYMMYANNHNGWALEFTFATRAPLKVTGGWWVLQRNHYELLERVLGSPRRN